MSAAPPLALPSAARGRASELVDALPYIDPLTDAERAKVDALIAAEAKQGDKKPEDYLRALPMLHPFRPATESPFVKDHPLVLKEYERCVTPSFCSPAAAAAGRRRRNGER
jgi:hypothetical protein